MCWGDNGSGQLGHGDKVDHHTAVEVLGIKNAHSLAASGVYACAIDKDQSKCWGGNWSGQLGNNSKTSSNEPVEVVTDISGSKLSGLRTIAVSLLHSCAVDNSDHLWCWGDNTYGELGDGTTTSSSVAIRGAEGLAVRAVSTALDATCIITTTGTVRCVGSNAYGQLGDGQMLYRPTAVITQ
jgi:alpha-tubulin suppressor-like RCC1 family protein